LAQYLSVCHSAWGPSADRHPKHLIDFTTTGSMLGAYSHGEIFHLSGRASRRPDRLDLARPAGWLPTYAAV